MHSLRVGSSLRDVVRTRIYLVDVDDFGPIGAVHGELMSEALPVNTSESRDRTV